MAAVSGVSSSDGDHHDLLDQGAADLARRTLKHGTLALLAINHHIGDHVMDRARPQAKAACGAANTGVSALLRNHTSMFILVTFLKAILMILWLAENAVIQSTMNHRLIVAHRDRVRGDDGRVDARSCSRELPAARAGCQARGRTHEALARHHSTRRISRLLRHSAPGHPAPRQMLCDRECLSV
jgi:hypothetical protein